MRKWCSQGRVRTFVQGQGAGYQREDRKLRGQEARSSVTLLLLGLLTSGSCSLSCCQRPSRPLPHPLSWVTPGPCLGCSPASQGPVCPWTRLPRGPQQRELPDAQARPAGWGGGVEGGGQCCACPGLEAGAGGSCAPDGQQVTARLPM